MGGPGSGRRPEGKAGRIGTVKTRMTKRSMISSSKQVRNSPKNFHLAKNGKFVRSR